MLARARRCVFSRCRLRSAARGSRRLPPTKTPQGLKFAGKALIIKTESKKGAAGLYNPQLETFIRVADAGSFNRAAEELYITAPAVIKQINLLESGLNLTLFVRTHRGLTLTKAGKSLYRDAKYMIQYSKDSVTRAKNAMQAEEAVIRIGTSPMTPGDFLVKLWPKIHSLCPDIKFQLVAFENTPENAREILANFGANIDVVAGHYDADFLTRCKCAALELYRSPVRCALSVHHRLANRERLTMEDLYGENFMLMRRGWNCVLDALRAEIEARHPQIYLVDFDFFSVSVFNQCENGNEIMAAVDEWMRVHPLIKVLEAEWDYAMSFGLLHAPEPSPIVARFLAAVQTAMKF